jgi:hypothetical protein
MVRSLIAVGSVAVLAVGACKTVGVVSTQYIEAHKPRLVWATFNDGSVVPIAGAVATDDSLSGFVKGQWVDYPMKNVKQVVSRRPAPVRTALLVAGLGVGTLATAIVLAGSTQPDPTDLANPNDDRLGQ